jgi:hypothetical protein
MKIYKKEKEKKTMLRLLWSCGPYSEEEESGSSDASF